MRSAETRCEAAEGQGHCFITVRTMRAIVAYCKHIAAWPAQVHSEAEVARILPIARRLGVPVTFRAAGTSLSGQAITDSVLLKLSHTGKNFRRYEIHVRLVVLPPLLLR